MSLHPMAASNIWELRAKMSIESFQRPRTLIEVGLGVNPNTRTQFCSKHHSEHPMSKHWTTASGGHRALVLCWEPVVTRLSSTDQYLTLVYVCFCKDALFNVYHWFLTVNLAQSARLRREGSLFNTRFLCKTHHSLLALGDTRQRFSIALGAILNSSIANKRHKKVKMWHI